MKLELTILNGPRKNELIELFEQDSTHYASPYILEDEAIDIKISLDSAYERVCLSLHENEIEYTDIFHDIRNNKWVYTWHPKKTINYQYETFFHNYFGIAEFFLILEHDEKEKLVLFQKIDVLAKKINAERVNDMLSFLAKHNNDALYSFFRVTRRNAGFKDGDTPADIFLEWMEKTIKNLSQLIDAILFEPITKLTTKYQFIAPTESTNVDDQTLSWICDNIEELFETPQEQDAILEYNGKFYSSLKIRESSLCNDSDVYENQVLHGFITTLKLAVSGLLAGFETPTQYQEKNNTYSEYVSFYNQIRKFQRKINHNKIKKCKEMLIYLNHIKRKLNKRIPVKRQLTGIPTLTMKVKNHKTYLSIFNKIISWYRFGSPDWSTQEELLSLKSIPKLFEYYSLFYLKEILDKYFRYTTPFDSNDGKSFFCYKINNTRITLHYEPKYWMHKNKKSGEESLINSENWTINNGKINIRNHFSKNSNRSPDFVITVENGVSRYHYILDAKYTTHKKGFTHYLPELTMKYLHGLHDISSKNKNILGLTVITPNISAIIKHYHTDSFNIFSDNPIEPSLNVGSISPGQEFQNNFIFEKMIGLIVDKMCKKFESRELPNIIQESA
ncbi:DUF2357 domain-containing protein [Photorhabdus bodei]|uniref:DUF2357 domain-containing protein n=1 Tax=Photorhabdus bodei TaxID=2029681 RepID=A0A329X694_9GAMM|nr:DUF2357 domain-containing protein [Photorhabdus bodei]NDL00354.1 DUF2357 domain-containing protein [Photorhabdus bodei]NDL04417.1 DUF2357 domain-containing protein [Photorhabdus bodei]NDL08813.1 DUF2357 domain-containing protein [Photorhabdus bodei]RAX11490.1 hypothetical protein CKY02_13415 [Photorhabdus bodei]